MSQFLRYSNMRQGAAVLRQALQSVIYDKISYCSSSLRFSLSRLDQRQPSCCVYPIIPAWALPGCPSDRTEISRDCAGFVTPPSLAPYLMIRTNGCREAPRARSMSVREGIIHAVILLLFNQLRRSVKPPAELDFAEVGGFRTRLRALRATDQLCHVIHFFCKLFILLFHHLAQLGTVGTLWNEPMLVAAFIPRLTVEGRERTLKRTILTTVRLRDGGTKSGPQL
jgi:hypothetical protein